MENILVTGATGTVGRQQTASRDRWSSGGPAEEGISAGGSGAPRDFASGPLSDNLGFLSGMSNRSRDA
jgi:hypothetical protein